ncbi:hypothetical protein ACIGZJ_26910 [Kitasatospora sp. NPDC052868]|uniref:hypothetical protein n=1 Tax=Kitasatospora sp. NPDC052868 TaxID=3364060 RepID=UPI0037CAFE21
MRPLQRPLERDHGRTSSSLEVKAGSHVLPIVRITDEQLESWTAQFAGGAA